jgi:hypothetical protein
MARADGVGPVLEQQVQLLVAEVEPHDHEIEGPRLGDFLQPQHVAVEAPAALHVADDDRNVVNLRDFKAGHGPLLFLVRL